MRPVSARDRCQSGNETASADWTWTDRATTTTTTTTTLPPPRPTNLPHALLSFDQQLTCIIPLHAYTYMCIYICIYTYIYIYVYNIYVFPFSRTCNPLFNRIVARSKPREIMPASLDRNSVRLWSNRFWRRKIRLRSISDDHRRPGRRRIW